MGLKRCFVKCAKLLPHQRECRFCRHTCALRGEKFVDFEQPIFADSHEEKAITMLNEDQKELTVA